MKIKVFKNGKEYKAVLTDGHRPKLTNWYDRISDIYDFADCMSERYGALVGVEFVR